MMHGHTNIKLDEEANLARTIPKILTPPYCSHLFTYRLSTVSHIFKKCKALKTYFLQGCIILSSTHLADNIQLYLK